jgi:hypothetical protein
MKRLLGFVLAIVAAAPTTGCILPGTPGSGVSATQNYDTKDFTSVDVSGAFQVTIKRSDKCDVSITADDNFLEFVDVRSSGDKLVISIQPGKNLRPKVTMKADIEMPEVTSVHLSGACTGSLTGFKHSKHFEAEVDGASTLNGDVNADKIELAANGASQFKLKGEGEACNADASGASRLHLADLELDRAVIRMSGASNGSVHVKKILNYDLSGASHLSYEGTPEIGKHEVSGASSASAK